MTSTAPTVDLAALREAGRTAYHRSGAMRAPFLDPIVRDALAGLPVGAGGVEVARAWLDGWDAEADLAVLAAVAAPGRAEAAGVLLTRVLGDSETAEGVGKAMTCSEADDLALALMLLGLRHAAWTLLVGHGAGDEEPADDADPDDECGDRHWWTRQVHADDADTCAATSQRVFEYLDALVGSVQDVRGCSCGQADLGAPGHDQH